MALFDAYLPAMAFAALFREDQTLHAIPYETVRADMDKLLERAADASASEARRHPVLAEDALFAVCAFVDEALLLTPWPGAEQWMRNTLQYERFRESNAGVVFYDRLQAILEGKRDPSHPLGTARPAGQAKEAAPGSGGLVPDPAATHSAAPSATTGACPPPIFPERTETSPYVSPLTGLPLASRSREFPPGKDAEAVAAASGGQPGRPQGILDYIESRKSVEVELPRRLLAFGRPSGRPEPSRPSGVSVPAPSSGPGRRALQPPAREEAPPLTTAYLGPAGQDDGEGALFASSPLSLDGKAEELASASSAKEETAALYAAALTLGFTGQYHSPETRDQLRKATLAGLDASLAGRISLSETLITPEAYYMPAGSGRSRNLSPLLHAVLVAVPALFTLFVYLVYDGILSAYAAEWLQKLGA